MSAELIKELTIEVNQQAEMIEGLANRVNQLNGHLNWLGWDSDGVEKARAEIERLRADLQTNEVAVSVLQQENERLHGLQAEVERLKDSMEAKHQLYNIVCEEAERLRDELNQLYRAVWELPEHEEIEATLDETICEIHNCNRLAAQMEQINDTKRILKEMSEAEVMVLVAKVKRLQAENERLQKALKESGRMENWPEWKRTALEQVISGGQSTV